MSKSSIKTKIALTMTDMTESIELQAFKRQKDGYKGTVKILLVYFCYSFLRRTQSMAKFTWLATMKCTWCAYLSLPFTGITRHNL